MDSEDNFSDGILKTRPVLTDVTNLPAKRPFSLISGDDDGDSQFAKQVCSGVENLVKKTCQMQFGAHTDQNNKDKGKNLCLELPFRSDTSLHNACQEPNLPSGVIKEQNENSVGLGEKDQVRNPNEGFVDHAELCVVGNSGSPKCAGGVYCDSKFLGLERCAGLKDQGGENSGVAGGGDLLKTCTCSFCSKAAYIWSDLHYQDVKGRLSALRKSQKEASMVVQKISGIKDTIIHGQQSGAVSSNLELTLMHQWKSLFVHMENIFTQESRQLESSFETLKDLRENCKNDLELSDNSNFGNH